LFSSATKTSTVWRPRDKLVYSTKCWSFAAERCVATDALLRSIGHQVQFQTSKVFLVGITFILFSCRRFDTYSSDFYFLREVEKIYFLNRWRNAKYPQLNQTQVIIRRMTLDV